MKALTLGTLLLSSVAFAGCTSESSSGTGGGMATTGASMSTGTPAMNCGSLKYSDIVVCETCVQGACCAELSACDKGTPCDKARDCIDQCKGDTGCRATCETMHKDGMAKMAALDQCTEKATGDKGKCQKDCLVDICGTGYGFSDEACNECLGKACCDVWTACFKDNACLACAGSPMQPANCATNPVYKAATECEKKSCQGECIGFPVCDSLFTASSQACSDCLSKACCSDFKACDADADMSCPNCFGDSPSDTCLQDPLVVAIDMCGTKNCQAECGGG